MSDQAFAPGPISEELTYLVSRYCDNALSDLETRRLEELLHDPAAQPFFLAYLDIHARLCWEFGAGLTAPAKPPAIASAERRENIRPSEEAAELSSTPASASLPKFFPSRFLSWVHVHDSVWKRIRFPRLVGITSLAALLLVALWLAFRPAETQNSIRQLGSMTVARVTRSLGARWAGQNSLVAPGDGLALGLLDLEQGLVEIAFTKGAIVLLEAPVQIELVGSDRAFLRSGRIVARVPKQAVEFTIETAKARLVDLGTEFGVRADSPGNTLVQVFAGEVIAEANHMGEENPSAWRLKTGQAWAIDETPAGISLREPPFVPDRFVRTFPPPREGRWPNAPYNESKFDTIHVLPAPARVVLDGDLSEWDRRGMFRSACTAPYDENYYVEGMMMYDAKRLYLGGHVGDPYPLRNRVDFSTDPSLFWAGGSVVVRLSTDKALGWPLQGLGDSHPRAKLLRAGQRPEDVSEGIVHVGMWNTQADGKPHLCLMYGMDLHGTVFDPDGWRGTFREDADGHGYVFEYAIPWSLLHAASPPQPGDALAAIWHVHWSNEDGRTCFGHLVEIVNRAEKPYNWLAGSAWGKAIYHRDRDFPARHR